MSSSWFSVTVKYYFAFQIGFQAIAEALGLAAVKAIVAIAAIIAGGRLVRFTCLLQQRIITIMSPVYIS